MQENPTNTFKRFTYDGLKAMSSYREHSGWVVEVIAPVWPNEPDIDPMFFIRADDGWLGYAFDSELSELPQ